MVGQGLGSTKSQNRWGQLPRPGSHTFSFDSINRELSNSKVVFSFFTTQQTGKEEELSVYYRVDFILVLFFFSCFEFANCAETSRAGLLVLLFFFSITAWKFMKSRQISGIHFFSGLLQL